MSDPSTNGGSGQGRYRFRVRLPDGTDHWSDTFEAPLKPPTSVLGTPRWSGQHYGHGERAVLEVEGTGLEGRKVKFILEQNKGDGWAPYAEAIGVMRNGLARAAIHLEHPEVKGGAAAQKANPIRLRFRCVLADAPALT